MTIQASYIIQRASSLLQDTTSVQWQVDELVRWFNDAQREILTYKPDANQKVGTATLVTGTRQDLTSTTGIATNNPYMLIDIVRNLGATSSKGAVRQITRDLMDRQNPTWHADTQSADIAHFIFDARFPTVFYVYPPASTGAQLEVLYSAYPVEVTVPSPGGTYTSVTGTLGVLDIYANAVLDYILYRAYMKDSDFAGNVQRAALYYAAFSNAIGVGTKGLQSDSPTTSPTA